MKDRAIIERILNAIAIRPDLRKQFADILGMPESVFKEWVELAQVPPTLPEKVFVTCRKVQGICAAHTTMDIAQREVDKRTMEFGDQYYIVETKLNP